MTVQNEVCCPQCGVRLTIVDSLRGVTVECPHCGGQLFAPISIDSGPTDNPSDLPAIQRTAVQRTASQQKKRQEEAGTLILTGLAVVLFAGVVIAYAFWPAGGGNATGGGGASIGDTITIRRDMAGMLFKEDYEEVINASNARDGVALRQMELQGRLFFFANPTRAKVIKTSFLLVRVRVLEGPHKDKAAWMPHDFVHN